MMGQGFINDIHGGLFVHCHIWSWTIMHDNTDTILHVDCRPLLCTRGTSWCIALLLHSLQWFGCLSQRASGHIKIPHGNTTLLQSISAVAGKDQVRSSYIHLCTCVWHCVNQPVDVASELWCMLAVDWKLYRPIVSKECLKHMQSK